MENIFLVPSEKTSRLFIWNGKLDLAQVETYGTPKIVPQNVYITDDEQLREGWCFYKNGDLVGIHKIVDDRTPKAMLVKNIIMALDPDLVKDGVQKIPEGFLEYLVENPECRNAEVKKIFNENWNEVSDEPYEVSYYEILNPYPKTIMEISASEFQKDFNGEVGKVLVESLVSGENVQNIFLLPTDGKPKHGDIILRHLWKGEPEECKSLWRFDEEIEIDGIVQYTTIGGSFRDVPSSFQTMNIYVTNKDIIDENNWYLSVKEGIIGKRHKIVNLSAVTPKWTQKIIMTDNSRLIKDGVEPLSQDFLNWFVKNPEYKKIEIDMIRAYHKESRKIVMIPKERFGTDFPSFDPTKTKLLGLEEASTNSISQWKKDVEDWGEKDNSLLKIDSEADFTHGFEKGARWQQSIIFDLFQKLVVRGCFKSDRDYVIAKQTLLEITGINYEKEVDERG